jgi:hypothetical protein
MKKYYLLSEFFHGFPFIFSCMVSHDISLDQLFRTGFSLVALLLNKKSRYNLIANPVPPYNIPTTLSKFTMASDIQQTPFIKQLAASGTHLPSTTF